MKISDITQFLETLAPLQFQEDYDNCGLLLGEAEDECRGILISLDCTEAIIEEAARQECNLLITHHPLIFHGLKQINSETSTGRAVLAAIRMGIAVYAIHTNLDNVLTGVNAAIADRLRLVSRRPLLHASGVQPPAGLVAGSGLIGELPEALAEKQFLALLKQQFRTPVIRHSPLTGKPVKRVALCGGSGSLMIVNALCENADFYVTADIKYHAFFEAEGRMVLADIGHFESEQFTTDLLYDAILKKFPNFAILKAGTATNPVHYYL